MKQQHKVAIITGANTGVGYAIVQRLLELERENITIIMACRNPKKAVAAQAALMQQFPYANIDIVVVDVSSAESVLNFTRTVNNSYPYINYLFCNAGVLDVERLDYINATILLLRHPVKMLEGADATIQKRGGINEDGIGSVFAANVFGHYIMVRELEELMSGSTDGRVIWTSSVTAKEDTFDIKDWQGIKTKTPYESSKWACSLMAIAMNDHFVQRGHTVSSYTTCPGVVASNIGNIPYWVLLARTMLHYMLRWAGYPSQNITGHNGAISQVFAALQVLSTLNIMLIYTSLTDRWGKNYVEAKVVKNYDPVVAEDLVQKCEVTYQTLKSKLGKPF